LLPLVVGHWLEGRGKRSVMVISDLARGTILLLVPLAFLTHHLNLALLSGVGFVLGIGSVIFEIAGFAYVPALVDQAHLAQANQAMQGSSTIMQIGGPGLAGLLVQGVGAPLALVVDAVSYTASILGIRAANRPEPDIGEANRGQLMDGLRFLFRNPVLRSLTLHAATYNLAAQVFVVNLLIWMVRIRHVTPGLYGLALSAAGAGADFFAAASAMVTAGLMWHPEMCPIA